MAPSMQGPRLIQLCVYWIIFIVLLIFVINYPAGLAQWRFFGTVIALVFLLALNVAWAAPNPDGAAELSAAKDWAFLILSAGFILAAAILSGQTDIAYMISLQAAQAAVKRGAWPAGFVYGAGNLLVWLLYMVWKGTAWSEIIAVESSLMIGLVMILLFVTLVKRYADQTKRAEALLKELQAASRELEEAHQKEKNLAIAEERVRLARDIHDGLGHHLTVLSIQLQAAGKLVERNPQAAAEAIQVCRLETQAALEEVRHSVSFMRQAPGENRPLPETLASLVESFGQHTGLRASFAVAGDPIEPSPFAREAFFRATQEGLTNVQKHAINASCVAVRLVYEAGSIRLSVLDDGVQSKGGSSTDDPHGFGLEGLCERAVQLGGVLHSGPTLSGGFELEVSLPIEGESHDPSSAAEPDSGGAAMGAKQGIRRYAHERMVGHGD